MNSKRSSRKLWRLIDSFFLLLPLLILIIGFIAYTGQYLHDNGLTNFAYGSYYNFVNGYIYSFFDDVYFIDFNHDFIFDNFFGPFSSLLIRFFGSDDTTFTYFIYGYFMYAISYEFFSFIIQIILWLPRWAKNKLYEWGDN